MTQLQQWRGLASGSSGKGKGGAEEEGGVFDHLKKTFTEEIDKVSAAATDRVASDIVLYCCSTLHQGL